LDPPPLDTACSIYCIGRALIGALVERFSRGLGRASIEPHTGVQTFLRAINRRDVYRDDRIGNHIDI
jgi:hypothetical protein